MVIKKKSTMSATKRKASTLKRKKTMLKKKENFEKKNTVNGKVNFFFKETNKESYKDLDEILN